MSEDGVLAEYLSSISAIKFMPGGTGEPLIVGLI